MRVRAKGPGRQLQTATAKTTTDAEPGGRDDAQKVVTRHGLFFGPATNRLVIRARLDNGSEAPR